MARSPRPAVRWFRLGPHYSRGVAVGRWRARAATSLLGCVVLSATLAPSAHAAPRAEDGTDASPLRITITGLTPGVLPRHGPVTLTGTVRNTDAVAWENVKLYPYLDDDGCVATGDCPPEMTTKEELADGADSDPAVPVGERVLEATDEFPTIAADETVAFTITVPQSVLRDKISSPQPGVYWFGVQAIGQSSTTPRDEVADGRARTFLPYIPQGYGGTGRHHPQAVLDTAVVVPVRAPIRHLADGRLADQRDWLTTLGSQGPLGGALAIGEASGGFPVTWLVDPAVPDAVQQLAHGNPPRLVPAAGSTPSGSPTPSPTGLDGGTSGTSSAGPLATAASRWLDDAKRSFGLGQLLTLPYGDPALIDSGFTRQLYQWARAQTGVLAGWKLRSRPTVASPDGYVDPAGLAAAQDRSLVLVGDQMLRRQVGGGELGDHRFLTTSSGAAGGGPGPNDRFSALAVRQRILSEAAVRLITGDDRPLVVQLPSRMDATGAGDFWTGLDQPWVRLTTVAGALKGTDATVDPQALRFPASQAAGSSELTGQSEAEQLVTSGRLLQAIIAPDHGDSSGSGSGSGDSGDSGDSASDAADSANADVGSAVTAEALAGTSYSLRDDTSVPGRLASSRQWIDGQLEGVTISAPPGVTLSSSDGSFAVTVTNGLDVPVTVQIASSADSVRMKRTDAVQLAANSRASVRLDAHTSRPGVHNVRLSLTDDTGTPIGASVTVPIRSGSVGVVIWAILATGAGILFLAIAIRLVRRIRGRRRGAEDPGDPGDPGDVTGAEA